MQVQDVISVEFSAHSQGQILGCDRGDRPLCRTFRLVLRRQLNQRKVGGSCMICIRQMLFVKNVIPWWILAQNVGAQKGGRPRCRSFRLVLRGQPNYDQRQTGCSNIIRIRQILSIDGYKHLSSDTCIYSIFLILIIFKQLPCFWWYK